MKLLSNMLVLSGLLFCHADDDTEFEKKLGKALKKLLGNSEDSQRSFIPPINLSDQPLIIRARVRVEDVNSVRTQYMDFTVDFFLQEIWDLSEASCMNYKKTIAENNLTDLVGTTTTIIPFSHIPRFWVPDTFIVNAKEVVAATETAKTLKFTDLDTRGCHLEFTQRLVAVIGCQMDFHQYPYDIQDCVTKFRSFSYPTPAIVYQWDQIKSLSKASDLLLLQQRLSLTKAAENALIMNENYSQILLEFHFTRDLSNSIVQIYVPSTLIVVLSWLSFWMGLEAVPGRVTLCVTTLLTLVTQFSAVRQNLPPVSYLCAIDVWMLSCLFFVFATMLEFSLIYFLEIQYKKPKIISPVPVISMQRRKSPFALEAEKILLNAGNGVIPYPRLSLQDRRVSPTPGTSPRKRSLKKETKENVPKRIYLANIDHISRKFFPIAFVVFNLIYWPSLLSRIF